MLAPDVIYTIDVYTKIHPSENVTKVKTAITNILPYIETKINNDSLYATSSNPESLTKIYESISSRNMQKTYKRHLNKNLNGLSTWFYLNKQAAFSNIVSLCDDTDESPMGPIKITLKSKNIEKVIEWLTAKLN